MEMSREGDKETETLKKRDSNLELYRIIITLMIVSHHYVVNSGLFTLVSNSEHYGWHAAFSLLFGCFGKVAINCFVLITGYFMCTSNITLKKFMKIFGELMFYRIAICVIFVVTGYGHMNLRNEILAIIPFRFLKDGFISCYLAFFLFIPFLNILIQAMTEKQHRYLLLLSVGIFSVWSMVPIVEVGFSYLIWFMILYLIAAYIRLHSTPWMENTKLWGAIALLAILCSYGSVLVMMKLFHGQFYYFLADSNKITALAVAVAVFMFFKNWKIKYNPIINMIGASTYGVLLIHASSDAMRQWLWVDTFKNVQFFDSPYQVLHACGTVVIIMAVCTVIDQVRIKVIERPFFGWWDKVVEKRG